MASCAWFWPSNHCNQIILHTFCLELDPSTAQPVSGSCTMHLPSMMCVNDGSWRGRGFFLALLFRSCHSPISSQSLFWATPPVCLFHFYYQWVPRTTYYTRSLCSTPLCTACVLRIRGIMWNVSTGFQAWRYCRYAACKPNHWLSLLFRPSDPPPSLILFF